jgi:hypothetical protein
MPGEAVLTQRRHSKRTIAVGEHRGVYGWKELGGTRDSNEMAQ